MRKRKIALLVVATTLAALAGRAALEPMVEGKLRRVLGAAPGYDGNFTDLRLRVLAGEAVLTGVTMKKAEESAPGFIFSADKAVVDIDWGRSLAERAFAGELVLNRPELTLLLRARRPGQKPRPGLWQKFFSRFPPFRLREVRVEDGLVRVLNRETEPVTDLLFDDIRFAGQGLANRPRLAPPRAFVSGRGRFGRGELRLRIAARPFLPDATFDMEGGLERFDLRELNVYLRRALGVDLEAGNLSLTADLSAAGGWFDGRVDRSMSNVDVIRSKAERQSPFEALKEFALEKWADRTADAEGRFKAAFRMTGPLGYKTSDIFQAAVWMARFSFLNSLRPVLPEEVELPLPETAEEEAARRRGD